MPVAWGTEPALPEAEAVISPPAVTAPGVTGAGAGAGELPTAVGAELPEGCDEDVPPAGCVEVEPAGCDEDEPAGCDVDELVVALEVVVLDDDVAGLVVVVVVVVRVVVVDVVAEAGGVPEGGVPSPKAQPSAEPVGGAYVEAPRCAYCQSPQVPSALRVACQ